MKGEKDRETGAAAADRESGRRIRRHPREEASKALSADRIRWTNQDVVLKRPTE